MATASGYGRVDESVIADLSKSISIKDLKAVAVAQMKITDVTVEDLEHENTGDTGAFKRAIIRTWVKQNPGPDQRQRLAGILYQSGMDANKVKDILEVTREQAAGIGEVSGSSQQEITEKYRKDIVKRVKKHTEKAMRIEMAPWVEGYTVKMEDLYTELTIEKIENKPSGPQGEVITDYNELFVNAKKSAKVTQSGDVGKRRSESEDESEESGDKVLIKADPGMGKSTLARKMGWDWAKNIVTLFQVVFFVSLKLIKPDDAIENIIIQQCPPLRSRKVTPQVLSKLLDTFGNTCLIILDGYDELDEQNVNVLELIRSENLSDCNILVTSRPHCSAEIEEHFWTIVKIQGFGQNHTKQFVSKFFSSEEEIQDVLSFNRENFTKVGETYTCPMILLFICILVNSDEIDLTRRDVPLGEIYWRLVRCIYRNYCEGNSITFSDSNFVEFLNTIGIFAGETLISQQVCFKLIEVIKAVGKDAFKYGFLSGDKDFRSQGHENSDMSVTFIHKTVQEFLGAFHIIKSAGKAPEMLVLVLTNNTVFQFCVDILQSKEIGSGAITDVARVSFEEKLERFLNTATLDLVLLFQTSRSLSIQHHYKKKNELVLNFYKLMLSKCSKIKHLILSVDDPIEWILGALGDNVSHLVSVQLLDKIHRHAQLDPLKWPLLSSGTTILLQAESYPKLNMDELLAQCSRLLGHPSLIVKKIEHDGTVDISTLMRHKIGKLCLHYPGVEPSQFYLNITQDLLKCSFLTHLLLINFTIEPCVLAALSKAMQNGNLPCLTHLSFAGCKYGIKGNLSRVLQPVWPSLVHLNLNGCHLDINDLKVIERSCTQFPKLESLVLFLGDELDNNGDITADNTNGLSSKKGDNDDVKNISFKLKWEREIDTKMFPLFQAPWPSITRLWLHDVNKEEYKMIVNALNQGKVPKLTKLGISMWKYVDVHQLVQIPIVREVRENHNILSFLQVNEIEYLDAVKVPTLTDLTLHRFICSMHHLYMITQSKVLTKLHKLDISHSSGMTGTLSILLCHKFPLLNSLILSDCGLNSQDLCSLAQASTKGRLPGLRLLDISHNGQLSGKLNNLFDTDSKWENLQHLNVESISSSCFLNLSDMVKDGCLRSLQKLGVSVGENISEYNTVPWCSLKILQISSESCSMGDILSAVFHLAIGGFFPSLETVHVKAELQVGTRAKDVKMTAALDKTLKGSALSPTCHGKVVRALLKSCFHFRETFFKEIRSNFDVSRRGFYARYDKQLDDMATAEVASVVDPLRKGWSDSDYKTIVNAGREYLRGTTKLRFIDPGKEPFNNKEKKFTYFKQYLMVKNIAVFCDDPTDNVYYDWCEADF